MIDPPRLRSHWRPRSRAGLGAVVAFLTLLALAQPPIVYRLANRIDPLVLGLPFLYAWLLFIYIALIGVLLWVYHKRL